MSLLDRDGVTLHYEVHNPSASATPVVLTHGFSATAEMWDDNVAALSAQRTVVTWDMRGHGRSSGPDGQDSYTEEIFCADLAAVLDAVRAERAVLTGMSLGGYLSLAFHLRHPERVAALVLVDTGPGFRNDAARERWNEVCAGMAAKVEADGFTGGLSPEVIRAHHDNPKALALVARGVMAQRDASVYESLPTIAVPTLVVVGDQDTAFLRAADYMTATIPGAAKAVIPNAGHASNIDDPAAFAAAVLPFLAAQ